LPAGADIFAVRVFDSGPAGTYHARAMGNLLRDRRAPSELAASRQVIDFEEKLKDFSHLAAIVEGDLESLDAAKMPPKWRDAAISGRLTFGFADAQSGLGAEGAWPMLHGKVAATIDAVCQRCLEPFQLPLAAELRLLFTDDASVGTAGDGFEVWELDEDKLRPLDLVEEALIMALPFAAMHDDDATCHEPEVLEEKPGKTTRPFADLKSQMGQED